jgi:hypothetical protein
LWLTLKKSARSGFSPPYGGYGANMFLCGKKVFANMWCLGPWPWLMANPLLHSSHALIISVASI